MKCMVCGKIFEAGNDPKTGIPNGIGLVFDEAGQKVFNVCSSCVSHRNEEAIEKAEKFRRGEDL